MLLLITLLTGCGSTKSNVATPSNGSNINYSDAKDYFKDLDISKEKLQNGEYVYVRAKGNWSALSMKHGNNYIRAALQKSAEDTISLNKQYFAIVKPNIISNTNGIKINTVKDFNNKCLSSNPLGGGDPCDIVDNGLLSNDGSKMIIKVFDSKPSDISVYSAKDVISDIKKNDDYQKDIAN